MLDEFRKVSKAEWLAKVEKDLKGKPMDSLNWSQEDRVYTPFFHADDAPQMGSVGDQSTNEWQICEVVIVDDIAVAHQQAIDALRKGANALSFQLSQPLTVAELSSLCEGIHLEWIHTHFEGDAEALAGLPAVFHSVVSAKGEKGYKVSCSFATVDATDIETIDEELPLAACYTIAEDKGSTVPQALAQMLITATSHIDTLAEANIEEQSWSQKLIFRVYLLDDYFLTIAKIRALQLLWSHLMYVWQGSETDTARVEAVAMIDEPDADENTNKIRLTSQAMAASIAGVERLTIYPSDHSKVPGGTVFSRRIALNIHHLLQQESYLHEVVDPASGSYYIETLTNDLAEAAWSIFQKESEA